MKLSRGFSLLEVMVAIAILGLAVTVILSAQGGLAATNKSAANMGSAITVGRCRMTELEEKLLKFGYPEIDEVDQSAVCCDDKEVSGFTCDWRVEKVILPNPPQNTVDGGFLSLGGSFDGGVPQGLSGPLGSVANNPAGGAGLDFDGGLQNIGQQLTSQMGGGGAGAAGMLNMVFGIVYPSLKLVLEASIRRVTVTIHWREGLKQRDLPLVQYVTNPMRFAAGTNIDGGALSDGGGAPAASGTGAPGGGAGPFAPGPQPNPGGGPIPRPF